MRKKHIPLRTCVICRKKTDKRRLQRIVRSPDGGISADPTGKQDGRGAYLCDDPNCWDKALASNILDLQLGTRISDEEKQNLAGYQPKVNQS